MEVGTFLLPSSVGTWTNDAAIKELNSKFTELVCSLCRMKFGRSIFDLWLMAVFDLFFFFFLGGGGGGGGDGSPCAIYKDTKKQLMIQVLKLQFWCPGYDAVPRLSFRSLENYETQPNTLRGTKSCNATVKQIHKVCFRAKRLKCWQSMHKVCQKIFQQKCIKRSHRLTLSDYNLQNFSKT